MGSWDWNDLVWEERDSGLPPGGGMMGCGCRVGGAYPGEGIGAGKESS